jgi:hypothetical protein
MYYLNSLKAFIKLMFITVAMLFLFVQLAISQEAVSQPEKPTNEAPYKWALLFQVTDDYFLTSFQGSTLSIVKNMSTTRHLRLGLTLRSNIDNTDNKNMVIGNYGNSDSYNNLRLNVHFITTPKSIEKFVPYCGAGPVFQFTYAHNKRNSNPIEGVKNTNNDLTLGVGASGILGVEWLILKNLSLSAEYGSNLIFSYATNESKTEQKIDGQYITTSKNTNTTKSCDLVNAGVKVGLSIYF